MHDEGKYYGDARKRVIEAHSVYNDILGEVEKGKLHPIDALEQMINEFTAIERAKWRIICRDRYEAENPSQQ